MNVERVRLGLVILACAAVPACQGPGSNNEGRVALPLQIEDTELSESAIDIGTCRDTECTAPTDDRPLASSEKRVCRPEERGQLRTEWFQDYTTPPDPACDPFTQPCGPEPRVTECGELGSCVITGFQIAPGIDDDLWVLGNISAPEYSPSLGGLWLAHYAADGEELSAEIVASDDVGEDRYVYYGGSISVDERNHVFLVASKQWGELDENQWLPTMDTEASSWLVEFDAEGEQVGPRVPLVGASDKPWFVAPRPAASGSGSLALFEQQLISGSIAMLSLESREPRWVQTREGRLGLGSSVVDADGEVSVLTISPDQSPSGRIEHYAANGELAWERTLPWRERRGFGGYGSELGLDGEGNLLSSQVEWAEFQETVVQKIGRDGQSAWIAAVGVAPPEEDSVSGWSISSGSGKVLAAADGTLYVNGGSVQTFDEDGVASPSTTFLYELSSDGERCGLWRWESELTDFQPVAVAGDGSFYFASWSGFGRVER
jgi:hypothetical protein